MIIHYQWQQAERVFMSRKYRIAVEIVGGTILIAALYFLIPVKKGPVDIDSGFRPVMGTIAHIIAVAPDSETGKKSIRAAFEQLNDIENLMSAHKDTSEISRTNRDAYKGAVKVSKATFEVLQRSIKFSRICGGDFDVTIGPLIDLWRSASEANSAPTDAELQQALSKVGYEKLILDANEMSVRFAVEGMKLDLGGTAKRYGIDKAAEAMQKCGASGGLVDVGGDIRCFGSPPNGKEYWLVGLQDPNVAETTLGESRCLFVLKLKDAAVTTSGDYRRFVRIKGKRYSHIINPHSGLTCNEFSSVTVIDANAANANALSLAVSVMGREKGLKFIEQLEGVEAILISHAPEYKIMLTKGVSRYINEMTETAMYKKYEVQKAGKKPKSDGDWSGEVWGRVKPIEIKERMGPEPKYRPAAQAKVLYDEQFVYVIFRVEDKYVKATAQKHQEPVFIDSCVEFFFTPGEDISQGYFNIEINCGGTVVSRHQTAPKTNPQPLTEGEIEILKIFHSEPKIVEPEKQQPMVWLIEYRVPYEILKKRCAVTRPAPGVKWRANFYKCGDKTSNPHWLTWSKVDYPEPRFHLPEFFGTLEFK